MNPRFICWLTVHGASPAIRRAITETLRFPVPNGLQPAIGRPGVDAKLVEDGESSFNHGKGSRRADSRGLLHRFQGESQPWRPKIPECSPRAGREIQPAHAHPVKPPGSMPSGNWGGAVGQGSARCRGGSPTLARKKAPGTVGTVPEALKARSVQPQVRSGSGDFEAGEFRAAERGGEGELHLGRRRERNGGPGTGFLRPRACQSG
jgi:hypothetical protein